MRYGKPLPAVGEVDGDRFWQSVDQGEGCWLWRGPIGNAGYGRFIVGQEQHAAHRIAWKLTHGVDPENEVLDHLCSNRLCVRVDHLEQVSQSENCRRGKNGYAQRNRCRAGLHDITNPENVRVGPKGNQCRECYLEAQRRYNNTRPERVARRRPAGPVEPLPVTEEEN